jgi:hypothetical protein
MQVKFPKVACMDVGYCTNQISVLLCELAVNSPSWGGCVHKALHKLRIPIFHINFGRRKCVWYAVKYGIHFYFNLNLQKPLYIPLFPCPPKKKNYCQAVDCAFYVWISVRTKIVFVTASVSHTTVYIYSSFHIIPCTVQHPLFWFHNWNQVETVASGNKLQ